MTLSKISIVMLGVENLDRSVAFYRDTLGLTLNHQGGGFAFFQAGGVTLGLSVSLGGIANPRAGATEVVFAVESAAEARSKLTAGGCLFINELRELIPGSWGSTFTDPDGHRLTVFGPK